MRLLFVIIFLLGLFAVLFLNIEILAGETIENKTNQMIETANPPKFPSHMPPFIFPQLYRCTRKEQLQQPSASQSREDVWLYENIFSSLPREELFGGTFIEIGALDGRTYSNTLYFEKMWDWRGILIEGHPANQPALRASQAFRSNSAIFTTGICEGTVGELTFTKGGGAVGAALEHANTKFLNDWHNGCLLYTSPSPRDGLLSRMPSSA